MTSNLERMEQLSQDMKEAYNKGYNNEPNPYFGVVCDGQGFGQTNSVLYRMYVKGKQDSP